MQYVYLSIFTFLLCFLSVGLTLVEDVSCFRLFAFSLVFFLVGLEFLDLVISMYILRLMLKIMIPCLALKSCFVGASLIWHLTKFIFAVVIATSYHFLLLGSTSFIRLLFILLDNYWDIYWCCISGWHICSSCQKAAHYMCYTCTFSLCKACTKYADYVCVRENKGFCTTCMKTIMLIENNGQGNSEMVSYYLCLFVLTFHVIAPANYWVFLFFPLFSLSSNVLNLVGQL